MSRFFRELRATLSYEVLLIQEIYFKREMNDGELCQRLLGDKIGIDCGNVCLCSLIELHYG